MVIDPEKLWFAGTLQGVLLLAEKRKDEGERARTRHP
jgi:hypothetical protein